MGGELERQSTDVGRGGRWKEWCKRSTRAILNRASYLLYVSLYMCGLFRNGGKYGHIGSVLKFFWVLTSSTPLEVGINLSEGFFVLY